MRARMSLKFHYPLHNDVFYGAARLAHLSPRTPCNDSHVICFDYLFYNKRKIYVDK